MKNRVRIRGVRAEVRYGYYTAAVLGAWSMEHGAVSAVVQSADALWVSQRPLTFEVPAPNGRWWTWPVTALQIAGGTLTASLGPQGVELHVLTHASAGNGHDPTLQG